MGITLEKKKRENGRFALYLSFCFEHKRWRESLHIMLEPPVDAATRRMNREKMKMAMAIRNKRELDFLANRNNVKSSNEAPASTGSTSSRNSSNNIRERTSRW